MSLMVSVDVKQHWTILTHWSQFVNLTSEDMKLYIVESGVSELMNCVKVEVAVLDSRP